MTEEKEAVQLILEKLKGQPDFVRDAAIWVINHYDLAVALCAPDDLFPPQEYEQALQKAIQTRDPVCCGLLVFYQVLKEHEEKEARGVEQREQLVTLGEERYR